jgi:hypothetical protein
MCSTFLGDLDDWGNIASIITPLIGLGWFLYSYIDKKSIDIYQSLVGNYATFIKNVNHNNSAGGILFTILDFKKNGYLRGSFHYKEFHNDDPSKGVEGISNFYIQMQSYDIFSLKRGGSPIEYERALITKGKLFVISRFDIAYDSVNSEDFISHVYKVKHFREVDLIELTLLEVKKEGIYKLPQQIALYPRLELTHTSNVYDNVKFLFDHHANEYG